MKGSNKMKLVLPEIVSIGIYNTQIAVKNKTLTKNRKTVMFEIEIPIEKGGTSHINNEQMPIDTDMIICAKPGQTRHTRLPFKCYYIHMIVNDGALKDILLSTPNFVKTDKYGKYLEIFESLCKYYGSADQRDEIIMQSLLLKLIYNLQKDFRSISEQEKTKNNNYKVIEKVLKYIDENITADLSLDTVSAYAGFSPVYFHNLFKASTGKKLHEYVEEKRIKKAADLLITTDRTLTEIAYTCGFSSQSYFSYAFKRKMKLTPKEYAKGVFKRYGEQL